MIFVNHKETEGNVPIFNFRWGLFGIALCGLLYVLSAISSSFASGPDTVILLLTLMLIIGGCIYLATIASLREVFASGKSLTLVIAIGLLMRITMIHSTPMLENDYFRYLWDGGVLANGYSPYRYSPSDIIGPSNEKNVPDQIKALAESSGPLVPNISYPWLKTIYPPIAQAAFSLAHFLHPWSLGAWRFIIICFDCITLCLLLGILSRLNLSLNQSAVYWWNPLLVKEIYNSAHMDVLLFPFLLTALWFAINHRYVFSAGALGLAVGIKLWPIILAPVLLRPLAHGDKKWFAAVLLFFLILIAVLFPFLISGVEYTSGLLTYSRHWEMNDALFMLLLWAVQWITTILSIEMVNAQVLTRMLSVGLLVFWILWLVRKPVGEPFEVADRCLLAVAGLFLLSPTQYPWYYLWMLPFLAISPRFPLLVFTMLLPLYYLRFFFASREMVHIHDYGIVWLEFVPVWILFVYTRYRCGKRMTEKLEVNV